MKCMALSFFYLLLPQYRTFFKQKNHFTILKNITYFPLQITKPQLFIDGPHLSNTDLEFQDKNGDCSGDVTKICVKLNPGTFSNAAVNAGRYRRKM